MKKEWILQFLARKLYARMQEAAGQPGMSRYAVSRADARKLAEQLING